MQYRPEIDGLRAVAVIPVMLFHAHVAAFGGGFVGVDVFFVISGYLITGIVHGEIRQGQFSLARFYERRARRILPALLFMCLVCIPFAWAWLLPDHLRDFSQSLVAVNLFVSNLLFWNEAGYFRAASELKPLLHTWSLAVEEQFYIVFPLLLLLLRRLRTARLTAVLLVLTLASLGLAQWASSAFPFGNFYLLPTRAWELAVGAMLALANRPSILEARGLREIASFLGLGLIAYAVLAFNDTTPFPSVWALAPVLGTALVVACADAGTVAGRLLAWRPFVFIGLISYSAYLWHQPLLAFARIRSLTALPPGAALALIAAALVAGYFSWRFIERPFRQRTAISRKGLIRWVAAASMIAIGFGVLGHLTNGFPARVPAEAVALEEWRHTSQLPAVRCMFAPDRPLDAALACRYGGDATKVAIWGDSHATALTIGLAEELARNGIGLVQYTTAACPPILGFAWRSGSWNCPDEARAMFDAIAGHYDTVILAARWAAYFDGSRFDNGEGGVERGRPDHPVHADGTEFPADDPDPLGRLTTNTIDTLLDAGIRVILIYPVPEVGWNVPYYLAYERNFGAERQTPLSTNWNVFKARNAHVYAVLDSLGDRPNLLRFRPEEVFCNTVLAGRCIAQLDGKPLYFDEHHLTSFGSALLAERIVAIMKDKGWP